MRNAELLGLQLFGKQQRFLKTNTTYWCQILFTRRIYKIHVVTSPDADLIQHVSITNAATPFSLSSREREFVISLAFLRTNNSDDVGTILALNDFNLFPILSAAHKYNQTRLLSQNDVLLSVCSDEKRRFETSNQQYGSAVDSCIQRSIVMFSDDFVDLAKLLDRR